ncbi:axonemal dynein light intermediate polypeptide 1-like [Gadus chalcogrammus]|uniref:axonemal dynein light intermediate polypeptide 1-like n=1 Tax=Gadus chalcogrammus TaxID=1042646 RepID=UPI0024C2CFB5|nr:axonemal dynein light intermediate polypeptide 1-like [Gadus chalcogrammus]XP_056448922.1 axonemal dynein light intermediate polypeptide 1-like [Gadus chalcogrammus]
MIPPAESLLRYDTPVLQSRAVERTADRKTPKARSLKPSPQQPPLSGPVPPPPRSPGADAPRQQTEEVLNALLPPREWAEAGQLWVQQVSSTPCTRSDVVQLTDQLDALLGRRQARETGICPVRRELYGQCFDELIRQVTINCAERGVLLLRIRNEIRMTVAAYQTLYESSMAFGVRKALQAEQGKSDMETRLRELELEKQDLEHQLSEQKARCEAVEKRELEIRQTEERKHGEEIQFLKRTNQQLKAQLEVTITPKK